MRLLACLATAFVASFMTGSPVQAQLNPGRTITYTTTPRSEFGPQPDNAYIIPRFKVLVGNADVVNSLPDSAIARIFGAFVREVQAVAITAKVDAGPEVPLLIVTRDGKTYVQQLAISRAAAPALAFPGGARTVTISMKSSKTFNAAIGATIFDNVAKVAPLIGGIPSVLASPEAKATGGALEGLLNATFATSAEFTFVNDMTFNDVKNTYATVMTFHDGDPSRNAPVIAQVQLELEVKTSLVGKRDEETGQFVDFEPYTALNAVIGSRPVNQILQQGDLGNLIGQVQGSKSLDAYLILCSQLRSAISKWGLNDADARAVFYSAISTLGTPPAGSEQCPSTEERRIMQDQYGLGSLPLPGAPRGAEPNAPGDDSQDRVWNATYKPFMMDPVAQAMKGARSFGDLAKSPVRLVQTVEALKGFPVSRAGRDASSSELDAIFKRGVVVEFGNYKYLGQGKVLVGAVTIGEEKLQASVTVARVLNDSNQVEIQIREIRLFTPI